MRPSSSRAATRASGRWTRPSSPARGSTAASGPRPGATTKFTFSTATLRAAIQALVWLTNRSNAAAPLTRPRSGWCSSGSPANDPIRASVSPVFRPSKYGTGPRRSRRCSSRLSRAAAEKSSGIHGTCQDSHSRSGGRRRSAAAGAALVGARDLEVLAHVHVVLALRRDHVHDVGPVAELHDLLDAPLVLGERRGLGLVGRRSRGRGAEAGRHAAAPGRVAGGRRLAAAGRLAGLGGGRRARRAVA